MEVNFGKISRYALLGGGKVLLEFAKLLLSSGYEVKVFSSSRLLTGSVDRDETTLEEALGRAGILYRDIITSPELDPVLTDWAKPDALAISFGAPWIFKRALINQFGGRLLNSHWSNLPLDRGGGGASWRIMRNDRSGASTLHQIDEGIDTGPIVKSHHYVFPNSCRTPSDYEWVTIAEDLKNLTEFVTQVESGETFHLVEQDEAQSTYFPRLHTANNGYVNWQWSASALERFFNAFDDPYPGVTSYLLGGRSVAKVRLKGCTLYQQDGLFHPFQAGLVYRKSQEKLWIATVDYAITVNSIASEDGRDLLAIVKPGYRLHTPREDLDRAISFRAVYTPTGLSN